MSKKSYKEGRFYKEYEAQRERNALARIRVFECHTPVKSVF